jgi:hypothetical protein
MTNEARGTRNRPTVPCRASAAPGRLAAMLLVGVSLGGCAGLRRTVMREDATTERSPSLPAAAPQPERERERRAELPRRIHAQVARRMPRHGPAIHEKVAGAVLDESTRAGVDPLLVLAMIHVESSFDPRAVSRAGAIGLMQVRLPTLRDELNRPRARRADAFDPLTNVQGGVRYLRRLLDSFGGMDLALMAYNAGPARLRQLLARGRIPARIRDYPRKVNGEVERLNVALGLAPRAPGPVVASEQRVAPAG